MRCRFRMDASSRPSSEPIENADKTNDGELIEGHECDPFTAQSEFLFSKKLYAQRTGRDQGKHDVIAYHVRMSFKPDEVTAEKALELGRELAMRWTKGNHQFIVAAHTNTKNPHTHIIFNSVNLDCTHKFEDFRRSAIALRRVSDQICLERGLSVIEKPGLSKGYNRAEYLGKNKPQTTRDRLRDMIDATLSGCKDYDSFLAALRASGVEIKSGKHLAFRMPDAKRFTRQDTLGEDYSANAILERINGKRIFVPRTKTNVTVTVPPKQNLLIDIQDRMQQGYGEGYRRWATTFNLKEAAKTLIFLQEHGISDYTLLEDRTATATKAFNSSGDRRKTIEVRLKEISSLQKHISAYGKTRDVYRQYRDSGWSKKFFAENKEAIATHREAKKVFDALGLKKLPSMQSLKTEYATLDSELRTLNKGYRSDREEMISLLMAKQNVDKILGGSDSSDKAYEHDVR